MLAILDAVVGVVATGLLAAGAVRAQALTPAAGAVATVCGAAIVILGGFAYLALLVLFFVGSVLATRVGFEEKRRRRVQEGTHGERRVANVLAHAIVPVALVVIALAVPSSLPMTTLAFLYTSALAFGAADTFGSELGVLSGRARSILSGRPVEPGTNGGVSALGEVWALVGALTTAAVGWGLFRLFSSPVPMPFPFVLGVAAIGFVGCQVDSVLGETVENRGWLGKSGTNFTAMVASVLIAVLCVAAAGGRV